MIECLALSIFDLSPPDAVHLIPPITKKKSVTTIARISITVIAELRIEPPFSGFRSHKLEKSPGGQIGTASVAKATFGKRARRANEMPVDS